MAYTIFILDNHTTQETTISQVLKDKFGYNTIVSDSADYGIRWIKSCSQPQPDLLLIDMLSSGEDIASIVRQIKTCKSQLPIIVMAQYGNEGQITPAIAAGADDFITKPVSLNRLKLTLENAFKIQHMNNEIARQKRKNMGHTHLSDLVGKSEHFQKTIHLCEMISSLDTPVWIHGEQGSGRETFARAIHGSSLRAGKPFIRVDCEHFSDEITENTLFGNAEPNGTLKPQSGKFQQANGGTLYLHEISGLPHYLQQRLIGVMDSREIKPVGSSLSIPVDVRIICSNSRDADDLIAVGEFSNVLFSKMCKNYLPIPSLRERIEDIVPLANYFLNSAATAENKLPPVLSEDAIELLKTYPWAGNVRQLANLLSRVVLLTQLDYVDAATIRLIQQIEPVNYTLPNTLKIPENSDYLDMKGQIKKLRSIEREAIQLALKHSDGCMTRAAKNLGIGRSTLYRKVEEMELSNLYAARKPDYAPDDAGFGW